jgi:hypothetical protein
MHGINLAASGTAGMQTFRKADGRAIVAYKAPLRGVDVNPSSMQPIAPPIIIFTGNPSRGRLICSIAMRAGAIDDQHLALCILCHPGGCYLAVRDVDRTIHMALCEGTRPAHIHKDEIRIGRFQTVVHIQQSFGRQSDYRHRALRRPCPYRPSDCGTAKQRNELSPLHLATQRLQYRAAANAAAPGCV